MRKTSKQINIQLSEEEQKIELALVRGNYSAIPNLSAEIERLRQVARSTIAKNKTINIRVSQRDYMRLKERALQEGIPYQTYVTSLLHKSLY